MEVRLNSSRGKFEITNMADDQVDLTPEDIPGVRFSAEEKGKLTVAQLKFWLKYRGIKQNGNFKKETVGKVGVHHRASRNGLAVSTTSLLKNSSCRHMFSHGQEPACKQ